MFNVQTLPYFLGGMYQTISVDEVPMFSWTIIPQPVFKNGVTQSSRTHYEVGMCLLDEDGKHKSLIVIGHHMRAAEALNCVMIAIQERLSDQLP